MNLWILCLSVLSFSLAFQVEGGFSQPKKKRNPTHSTIRKHKKKSPLTNPCAKEIPFGIKGNLLFFSGNMMPSPDRPAPSGSPVVRKVALFEITTLDQVIEGEQGGFYKKIKTRKRMECQSNEQGCFAFRVKPGRYSLFVWEKGEWYANSVGDKGEIMAVEVLENQVTEVEFRINYAAAF